MLVHQSDDLAMRTPGGAESRCKSRTPLAPVIVRGMRDGFVLMAHLIVTTIRIVTPTNAESRGRCQTRDAPAISPSAGPT
jgi:hypothetical protein